MRKCALYSGLVVILALAVACTGELQPFDPIGGGGGGGNDPNLGDPLVQQQFTQTVQPLMNINRPKGSCAFCHQTDLGGPGPDFLGTSQADNLRAVLAYPNLILPGNPAASRLQNYGVHTGDALEITESDAISNWVLMLQ